MATTKKPAAKKPAAKKSAPKKTTASKTNKKPAAVVIGDEDNKSFKAQEKEISRVQNKERKETKKDAEAAFGGKKENWFKRTWNKMFHKNK